MGLFKKKVHPRIERLNQLAAKLVDKKLVDVWYHDCTQEDGTPFYQDSQSTLRHELMQGIDLTVSDGTTHGFYWEWFEEYELEIIEEGLKSLNLNKGLSITNTSTETQWAQRIGNIIKMLTFTTDKWGCLIDCRIDFDGADPVWICARQANNDCMSNGDDTIVIFDEHEAKRVGIKVS